MDGVTRAIMTTLNTITFLLSFVLKKMAARFLEISEEEMQKLAERALKKNAVGTVWKSWAGSKGLKDEIVD